MAMAIELDAGKMFDLDVLCGQLPFLLLG